MRTNVSSIPINVLQNTERFIYLKNQTTNNVTNNAVFVGSTTELQKMLKDGILNNKEDNT